MSTSILPETSIKLDPMLALRARAAVAIAVTVCSGSPRLLRRFLSLLTLGARRPHPAELLRWRQAVVTVSRRCAGSHCLQRSVATMILARSFGYIATWKSGVRQDPFLAHAWVELDDAPIGEPDSVREFHHVLAVWPAYAGSSGQATQAAQNVGEPMSGPHPSIPAGAAPGSIGFHAALPLLRPYWKPLVAAFLLGLVATAAGAAQPLVISSMVDAFHGPFPVASTVALAGLLVAGAVLTGLRQLLLQLAGERFAFDTREQLVRHVYALPLAVLDEQRRADVVSRVTADVAQTRAIVTSGLVELASSGATILASLVLMGLIDPVLLGLSILVVTLIFVSVFLIGRRTRPSGLRMQSALGELAAALTRGLTAMRTIRATRATHREAGATVEAAAEALKAGLIAARLRAIIQTFTGLAVQVLLLVVVGAGALRVASGALTVGQLSAFVMYLVLVAAPISLFGGIMAQLGEAFGALARILELRAMAPETDIAAHDIATRNLTTTGATAANATAPERGASRMPAPGPLALPSARLAGERTLFRFEDVTFFYPSNCEQSGQPALANVNLAIRAGVTTAFVGPSGSGKSTLFSLLERFYEPTEGRILYRGQDVRSISRDKLRADMAYVEQDAPVLSGSVRDNLTLGAPHATEAECIAALIDVHLALDSAAGSRYLRLPVGEVGSRLSGGERQRLAIARALIARMPVLLLDEVTSNLDGRNERLIQELIRARRADRTILIIAHRLSTVVAAAHIVLLDAGRVVAQGTHNELLRDSPLYRELAEHQLLADDPASRTTSG